MPSVPALSPQSEGKQREDPKFRDLPKLPTEELLADPSLSASLFFQAFLMLDATVWFVFACCPQLWFLLPLQGPGVCICWLKKPHWGRGGHTERPCDVRAGRG